MAPATDRHGVLIHIGDRVRAKNGEVFTVTGIGEGKTHLYKAADCEIIPAPEGRRPERARDGDTVIWGN